MAKTSMLFESSLQTNEQWWRQVALANNSLKHENSSKNSDTENSQQSWNRGVQRHHETIKKITLVEVYFFSLEDEGDDWDAREGAMRFQRELLQRCVPHLGEIMIETMEMQRETK